jgi:hypothetical protein
MAFKTLKKISFLITTILSSVLYVVDIGTDILLAARYFRRGHRNWGICTTVFIAVPWTLLGVGAAWFAFVLDFGIHGQRSQLILVFAVFGMVPLFINIVSLKAWAFGKGWLWTP